MVFRKAVFLVISLSFSLFTFSVKASSPQQIRELFEWGEYPKLINELEPYLNVVPDTVDSNLIALYHCYLAVAYFSLGKIGEARTRFFSALNYNRNLEIDPRYVTEQIMDLFAVTKSEYVHQKKKLLYQDSIAIARQISYESSLLKVKREALQRRKRNNSIFAYSFAGIGAVFLGIAAFEYHTSKEPYEEFKKAASRGDKETYDRYRPIIKQANVIITGSGIVAGACFTSGIFFTVRIGKLKREIK